jgi:hypothetical protein
MKSDPTCNDFVKYVFHRVAMPDYGAALQLNFHTAAPTVATDFAPTATNYAPQTVVADATGWTICDPDGTPNADGVAAKSAAAVDFPEIEPGFVGSEEWTHGSLSVVATGQILYSSELTTPDGTAPAPIEIFALSTPRFPAGVVMFREA